MPAITMAHGYAGVKEHGITRFAGAFGGAVTAYVKTLQGRIGKQEQALTEYKLEVAQHYVSKEYMAESERRILDSIRDLARRIDHVFHIDRE